MKFLSALNTGIQMKDLKSIFNHPPKANPENDPHLYEWKHPIHGKDDGEALNRLLNQKKKRRYLEHHLNSKVLPLALAFEFR